MTMGRRMIGVAIVLAAQAVVSGAAPAVVQSAASAVGHGTTKAQGSASHAARVAASGAERGFKAAGRAVTRTTRKLGLPDGASAPGR